MKLSIVILLFGSCSLKSQKINLLTESQYTNIYINGVKWSNISNTKGDVSKMKTLMKMNFEKEVETEPNDIVYLSNSTNGISFHFELNNPNNQADYILYGFEIKNSQVNFEILGKTVKVGDSISKFGTIETNIFRGVKTAVFVGDGRDSESIAIEFDKNNRVKLIKYTLFY